jgi:hypothetical protein
MHKKQYNYDNNNNRGFTYLNTREHNKSANLIGIAQEAQTNKQAGQKRQGSSNISCQM